MFCRLGEGSSSSEAQRLMSSHERAGWAGPAVGVDSAPTWAGVALRGDSPALEFGCVPMR